MRHFLDARTEILPAELGEFERAWQELEEEHKELAVEHFQKLLEVLPKRPRGELIYVMGYLNKPLDDSHVTILGPVIFPGVNELNNFISQAQEITEETKSLQVRLGEPKELKKDKYGFSLIEAEPIMKLHRQLYDIAKRLEGFLPEEHFAFENYFPHVTDSDYGLRAGDEFSIDELSISLHPGARINVAQAYEIANFKLNLPN